MGAEVANPDRGIAKIAGAQRGVISVGQLREAGVGRGGVRSRVESGRLHRVHRGVYAVGHLAVGAEGRWMAAVLACGGGPGFGGTVLDHWGAALSHRSAACLWGLLPVGERAIDVSVPGNGGRARRDKIRLHRSLTLVPAVVTLHRGIPVTTPVRTISDLRKMTIRHGRHGAITERELRRAVRQADVLGLPIGEDRQRDRTRSDLERDFLRLCRRHGLSPPEVNVRIGDHLVDFFWREAMLVVETDGYVYHRGRAAFEDDRARDLDLRARGYEVIRLAGRQIEGEAERVAEVLADALRVGADASESA